MRSINIIINSKTFSCLLAETNEEQEKGLMYVKPPVPNMAFKYSSPKDVSFWMKNTPAPLDIVFCKNNKIVDIKKGTPYSTELIRPRTSSDLIIEFNSGSASLFGFQIGDEVFVDGN